MRKRLAGGVFIAAATAIAFQTPHLLIETSKPNASVRQVEMKNSDSHIAENFQKDDKVELACQVPIQYVETIDGDTIKAKVNEKVETIRYLLVDTPESKKPGMCVQPYAKEAAIRNNQLVSSGQLTMELEKKNRRNWDSYGRLLAYVYVNGKSVQEALLKEGYARVAYIMDPPYKYLSLFRKDETLAKRNKVNIWCRKGYVSSWGFIECIP